MKTKEDRKSFFKNEAGGMAILLSVFVLSGIAVTTLTSVYVFLENRAQYNKRINSAYQTAQGMEDIAAAMRQVYDMTITSGAMTISSTGQVINRNPALCSAGTMPYAYNIAGSQTLLLCIPSNMYRGSTTQAFGCKAAPCFCVSTSSGLGMNGEYCTGLAVGTSMTGVQEKEEVYGSIKKSSSLTSTWMANLHRFFDSTVSVESRSLTEPMHELLAYQIRRPELLDVFLPFARAWEDGLYKEDRGFQDLGKGENSEAGTFNEEPQGLPGVSEGNPTQPPRATALAIVYTKSCTGASALTDPACEMCAGQSCVPFKSQAILCSDFPNVADCPYGDGEMYIKFE